jgi:ribosomal protein S11
MNRKLLHRIYLPILCIVLLISASVSSAAPIPAALKNIPQPPAVTQRISFAPGGTSATVSGQVDGTTVDTYLLNARAGQYMQVAVASPGGNVYLTVVSPFGSPLARAQNGAQSFVGTLPENGDYTLQVSAPSGTPLTNYTLSVSVTGSAIPPTQQGPVAGSTERINFAPGGTSAQVNGQVGGYVVNYYLVNAQAGQLMQASVTSPGNNVFMTVAAPSGAILASAPAGAKSYTGTLTESGDYTLRISTIPGGAQTNYTVSVSITGGGVQPPPQTGNQRIQFAQGATSATVTGQVSGDVFNGYVIRALAGQRMQLTLMTFALPIYLTLISPGGSPLARAQAGAQSFDGVLPETGDYTIQISAPAGTTTTPYALVVFVTNMPSPTTTNERISYATGRSSVQVFDQIDGNSMDTYLLYISADQQLQITVQSPANNVYLTLVSPGGSPLARAQNGAQNFDQIVSETGDYTIQISAPAGTTQTTYTLTATAIGAVVQPPPPSGGTQRINFAPGATSAQRSGQVDGNTYVGYVLNARAGQHMQINVASPAGNVYLTLVSPGGSPLARAQAGAQSFDGILPESGDYNVQISAPSGTTLTTYLLSVAMS